MICIYQTQDSVHAHLVKHQLEEMGIPASVQTNDACGTLSHLRTILPIEIYVDEKDLERAKKILCELEEPKQS